MENRQSSGLERGVGGRQEAGCRRQASFVSVMQCSPTCGAKPFGLGVERVAALKCLGVWAILTPPCFDFRAAAWIDT